MATVMLNQNWEVYATTSVELPEGKTQEDISDIDTKWDQTTIEFKDGTGIMVNNNVGDADGDWKYPIKETISDEDFNDFIEF